MTEAPQGTPPAELARARRLLEAGWYLHRGGFFEDAVSRAYYAVFHAASALLASIGRTVRTHDGLRAAVAQHFVKPGHLSPKYSRVLARIAADRNDADYGAVTVMRAEDAEETLGEAEDFVAAVETYLAARGAVTE
jgi:uncharacterized protein (UPF0332 family)